MYRLINQKTALVLAASLCLAVPLYAGTNFAKSPEKTETKPEAKVKEMVMDTVAAAPVPASKPTDLSHEAKKNAQ